MSTHFKISLLSLLFLLSIKIANCQIREVIEAIKPAKAFEGTPILKKKSQMLQVGIGAPNNIASFIKAPAAIVNTIGGILGGLGLITANPSSTSTSNKTGPYYLDYEYLIKENLGLGIGLSYASATEIGTIPLLVPTTTTAKVSATSVLLSTVYHFYITDKLDPYSKVSIGATLWKGSYKNADGSDAGTLPLPTPIAYRALVGLRYFVSPNIAPYGEASYSNLKFSANIGIAFKLQ
jgi:Outer membrane protein beta-barrel domain